MPELPTSLGRVQTPEYTGRVQTSNVDPYRGQAMQAAELSELGKSLQTFGHLSNEVTEVENKAKVEDAVMQARRKALDLAYDPDKGYLNLKGKDAVTRPDGVSLPSEIDQRLSADIDAIGATLGDGRVRREFNQQAEALRLSTRAQVESHTLQQVVAYRDSVSKGQIAIAQDDSFLNWNNPQRIEANANKAALAVAAQATTEGWSPAYTQSKQLEAVGKIKAGALKLAVDNQDFDYAAKMKDAWTKDGSLSLDDAMGLNAHIDAGRAKVYSANAVAGANTDAQRILNPSVVDRAWAAMRGLESGGKQFDSTGAPLTSAAGAVGVAQVMPTTGPEAAKLAGVPWDETKFKTDAAYNESLGRAYFTQKLRDNGGDIQKAAAAYNAGQGNVDKAVKEANDAGEPDSWLSRLPKPAETIPYVAGVMDAVNNTEQASGRVPTVQEYVAAGTRYIPADASPTIRAAAIQQLEHAHTQLMNSIKQQATALEDEGYVAIQNANGDPSAITPEMKQRALATGQGGTLIKKWEAYTKAQNANRVLDPVAYERVARNLSSMTMPEIREATAAMPLVEQKRFIDQKLELDSGKTSEAKDSINLTAFNNTLDTIIGGMGLNPKPEAKNTQEVARIGAMRQLMSDAVYSEQAARGKKLDPKELDSFLRKTALAKIETKTGWFDAARDYSGPAIGMTYKNIPVDAAARIRAYGAKIGIGEMSDDEVLSKYLASVSASRARALPVAAVVEQPKTQALGLPIMAPM